MERPYIITIQIWHIDQENGTVKLWLQNGEEAAELECSGPQDTEALPSGYPLPEYQDTVVVVWAPSEPAAHYRPVKATTAWLDAVGFDGQAAQGWES